MSDALLETMSVLISSARVANAVGMSIKTWSNLYAQVQSGEEIDREKLLIEVESEIDANQAIVDEYS